MRGILRATGMLGIDGRRQIEVTSDCFDAYLSGPVTTRLDLASPLYPELRIIDQTRAETPVLPFIPRQVPR